MGRLGSEEYSLVFIDDTGNKYRLLDARYPVTNYGILPMHDFNAQKTMLEYLLDVNDQQDAKAQGTVEHDILALMTNAVIMNYLSKTALPVTAAGIGCQLGVCGWNIATIIDMFNGKSTLDILGNDSYDVTPKAYDIVVVSAGCGYSDYVEILRRAENAIKKTGLLVIQIRTTVNGITPDMVCRVLSQNFRVEEYMLDAEKGIIVINNTNEPVYVDSVEAFPNIYEIKEGISRDECQELLHDISMEIVKCKSSLMMQYKHYLIEQREQLMNIMIGS